MPFREPCKVSPMWMNGTTVGAAISRPPRSEYNLCEWYTQCSGDDSSPCNLTSITRVDKRNHTHVIPTEMKWSGGIFPSSNNNLRKVKSVTREDSSTRCRSLGMTCREAVFCPHRLYSKRGGRQIAAPTCTSVSGSVQPHRFYSERCMAMNHRRYIAWFHSTARVVFGTFPERHTGRSLHTLPDGYMRTTLVAPIIVNSKITVN